MVHGHVAAGLRVPLEHREFIDPKRRPAICRQLAIVTDSDQQLAHEGARGEPVAGAEQQYVSALHAGGPGYALPRRVVQELGDRRLQAPDAGGSVVDLDPGQALRTVAAGIGGILINLLAGELRPAGHAQRGHAGTVLVGRAREHLELEVLHVLVDGHQLHRDAQVRLVGAVAVQGIAPAHAREGVRQIDIQRVAEHVANHGL